MLNVYIKLQVNRLTDFLAVHSRFLQALRRLFPFFFLNLQNDQLGPQIEHQQGKPFAAMLSSYSKEII